MPYGKVPCPKCGRPKVWSAQVCRSCRRKTPIERMEALVRVDANGCWIWQGFCGWYGYGRVNYRGRPVSAHRLAYHLIKGPIPEGMFLDHLCRTPSCCNPEHLEAVTPAENIRRGLQGTLKTHCANGHPWVPENIADNGRTASGGVARCCALCRREGNRRRSVERRARVAA